MKATTAAAMVQMAGGGTSRTIRRFCVISVALAEPAAEQKCRFSGNLVIYATNAAKSATYVGGELIFQALVFAFSPLCHVMQRGGGEDLNHFPKLQ
jgi:hypothetical protein